MGTDIHMVVETATFDEEGEQTGWELVPGPVIDCWSCKGLGVIDAEVHRHCNAEWLAKNLGKPCDWCCSPVQYGEINDRYVGPGKTRDEWYSDRNYVVFGVLADVRNGSGFAGADTGNAVEPITEQRGLPDDMSDAAYVWFRHHGGDHSDTWLMLDEVLQYDWSREIIKRGCVTVDDYRVYVQRGRPENWCADVSGGRIRFVDQATMNGYLINRPEDADYVYCRIQWSDSLEHYAEAFIERMHMLVAEVGGRKTRLVFNFDS